MKSTFIAYILWFFFGLIGFHRFYLDKVGSGFLIYWVGWVFPPVPIIMFILDMFNIPAMVRECNMYAIAGNTNNNNMQNNQTVNVVISPEMIEQYNTRQLKHK